MRQDRIYISVMRLSVGSIAYHEKDYVGLLRYNTGVKFLHGFW